MYQLPAYFGGLRYVSEYQACDNYPVIEVGLTTGGEPGEDFSNGRG